MKKSLYFLKIILWKNVICLINWINKFCTFYMITHFHKFHIWLERKKTYYPYFFKSWLKKNKIISLKNTTFWKTHLFINLDQQSMKILHDCTFLYISLTIGVSNILVPPFFLITFSMENYVISEKYDFLSNYICLINQLNKVCTFLCNQTFKYILHTILNMKRLLPLF